MKFSITNNWHKVEKNWSDITILRINWQFDEYYRGIGIEILNFTLYVSEG